MPLAVYNPEHSRAIISINCKMIVHIIGFCGSGQIQAMLPHLGIETHGETPQAAPTDLIHSFPLNRQAMYEWYESAMTRKTMYTYTAITR